MCEIHFIKPKDRNVNEYDIKQILYMMKTSSCNKDGYGLTNGIVIKKGETKYNKKMDGKMQEAFKDSKFLFAHNRLKTSGMIKKGHSHPFRNVRFIWVHNGCIWNDNELATKYQLNNVDMDSKIIGELLLRKCKDNEDIVQTIIKTMQKISGTFSVFLYDIKTNRLFYFRCGQDYMFRVIEKDKDFILIGSSDESNLNTVYMDKNGSKFGIPTLQYKIISMFKPKNCCIYEINDIGLKKVGEFKENIEDDWRYYNSYGMIRGHYNSSLDMDYNKKYDTEDWMITDMKEFAGLVFNEKIKIRKIENNEDTQYILMCSDDAKNSLNDYMLESGVDVFQPIDDEAFDMLYNVLAELYEYYQYNYD